MLGLALVHLMVPEPTELLEPLVPRELMDLRPLVPTELTELRPLVPKEPMVPLALRLALALAPPPLTALEELPVPLPPTRPGESLKFATCPTQLTISLPSACR